MQLGSVAAGAVLWLCLAVQPALAACLVAIPTPGLLGLSNDGKTLGSAVGLGVPSIVTVSNLPLGASSINIGNLRLESASGVPPGATLSGSYSASWLLGGTSGAVSNGSPGVIHLNLISALAVTITLHNSAVSASGFRQGSYAMKTSVTCS